MEFIRNRFHPRRGLLFFLIPPLAWLAGCVSPETTRRQEQGDDGAFVFAEPELHAVNEQFAEALAHFSVALSHELHGEPEQALQRYLAAIEMDPGNETLYMIASRRLFDRGDRDNAFLLMQKLLDRAPENPRALLWTSQLHLLDRDEDRALELLLRLTEADPTLEVAWLEAARLSLRAGETDRALSLTRRGVALASDPLRVTQLHAELLLRQADATLDPEVSETLQTEAAGVLAAGRERFPEHHPFYLLAAGIEARRDNLPALMEILIALDRQENGSMEIRNTLVVQTARLLGSTRRAERRLTAYIAEFPDEPLPHFLLGLLAELDRRPADALAAYGRVLDIAPGDTNAIRKKAVILYGTGEARRAIGLLSRALEAEPDAQDLLRMAGGFHLAMEDYEQAERVLGRLDTIRRRGVEIDDPFQVRVMHAMALLAVGKAAEAVDPMVAVARENRDALDEIWRHQVRLAFLAGDEKELREQREQTLLKAFHLLSDRLPEDPGILRHAARVHLFRREHQEGLELLKQARRVAEGLESPGDWLDADFFFDLGSSLERTGRREEAEEIFEKVIGKDPDHHLALNYLAYMWAEDGRNLERALGYVQRALRHDPNNGAYIDTRGWIFYKQGRYDEAYVDLLRAAELEPDESVIAEHVGDVLMKLNRPVEAAAWYRIALELEPEEREEILRASLDRAEDAVAEMFRQPAPEPEPEPEPESEPESDSNNQTDVEP